MIPRKAVVLIRTLKALQVLSERTTIKQADQVPAWII